MKILGISAYYHDSAAALVEDGKIIAAAQEERFNRLKHTAVFPMEAIKYCLSEANCTINELDYIVFYDKPFLKFERLLETYVRFAPRGFGSFIKAIPIWIKEKLFTKRELLNGLKSLGFDSKSNIKLLFSEHHLSHAASAYFPSTFKKAAILTIDGVGEWATCSISLGEGNQLKMLKEMHFPDSVGLLYSAFTYYLGFKVNSGEYKLMGLAPYGNRHSKLCQQFIYLIKTELITIYEDGSLSINQSYFNYTTGLTMTKDKRWFKLFGVTRRNASDSILQVHCELAAAIQSVTEEIVIKLANEAKRLTNCNHLCLAGGVALNCVANGELRRANVFEQIYVQPAAGDAGGALGAALAIYHLYAEQAKSNEVDLMQGAYLGPSYNMFEIEDALKAMCAKYTKANNEQELCARAAEYLVEGRIVGWFRGRAEYGPRALGSRSIFADPTKVHMQTHLNLRIKFRESFRPFAPIMLEEEAEKYYNAAPSPYMLFTEKILESYRLQSYPNHAITFEKKLEQQVSVLPAITHVDYSSRIQTVNSKSQPVLTNLLNAFKQKSGFGVLVNTSFNVRGEPMVHTPLDAYKCFISTGMDVLVIEDFILLKEEQSQENLTKFKVQFPDD